MPSLTVSSKSTAAGPALDARRVKILPIRSARMFRAHEHGAREGWGLITRSYCFATKCSSPSQSRSSVVRLRNHRRRVRKTKLAASPFLDSPWLSLQLFYLLRCCSDQFQMPRRSPCQRRSVAATLPAAAERPPCRRMYPDDRQPQHTNLCTATLTAPPAAVPRHGPLLCRASGSLPRKLERDRKRRLPRAAALPTAPARPVGPPAPMEPGPVPDLAPSERGRAGSATGQAGQAGPKLQAPRSRPLRSAGGTLHQQHGHCARATKPQGLLREPPEL